MHDLPQKLACAGGKFLVLDEPYHGRADMHAFRAAVRASYAEWVSPSEENSLINLHIMPTGELTLTGRCHGRVTDRRCQRARRHGKLSTERGLQPTALKADELLAQSRLLASIVWKCPSLRVASSARR